jgi:hypothetical protein
MHRAMISTQAAVGDLILKLLHLVTIFDELKMVLAACEIQGWRLSVHNDLHRLGLSLHTGSRLTEIPPILDHTQLPVGAQLGLSPDAQPGELLVNPSHLTSAMAPLVMQVASGQIPHSWTCSSLDLVPNKAVDL